MAQKSVASFFRIRIFIRMGGIYTDPALDVDDEERDPVNYRNVCKKTFRSEYAAFIHMQTIFGNARTEFVLVKFG
jgi:hypothetical protein